MRRSRTRLTGEAVEDVGLGDEHLVEAPVPHHRDDDDRAADDHVDPARFEAGVVAALRDRLGRQRAEHLLGGRARQPEVVDALAVATRRRRARSRPSSTPCPRSRSASSRSRRRAPSRSTSARWSRTTDTRLAQLLGRRADRAWRNCSVSRTQPMSIDISPSGASVPTMNSVEPPPTSNDEVRPGLGRARRSRPGTSSARLFLAGEQLGSDAEHAASAGVEEVVAVRRVTRRAGRRRAHALRRRARSISSRYSRSTATVRSIASGCSRARRVDTLTEARDPRVALDGSERARRRRPSTSATSRRVELVPMSMAATRIVGSVASTGEAAATHRPTGSSPPARCQA